MTQLFCISMKQCTYWAPTAEDIAAIIHDTLILSLHVTKALESNHSSKTSHTDVVRACNALISFFPQSKMIHSEDTPTDNSFIFSLSTAKNAAQALCVPNNQRNESLTSLSGCAAALRIGLYDCYENKIALQYIKIYKKHANLIPAILYSNSWKINSISGSFQIPITDATDAVLVKMMHHHHQTCFFWYCSQECNQTSWKQHKKQCNSKWRTRMLEMKSQQEYERVKSAVTKDLNDGGTGVCLEVDLITKEPFVFCFDSVTKMLFDGLTDRNVTYFGKQQSKIIVSVNLERDVSLYKRIL